MKDTTIEKILVLSYVGIFTLLAPAAVGCGAADDGPPEIHSQVADGPKVATVAFEAETAEINNGVVVWSEGLSYVENGDYVGYRNVDFGMGFTTPTFALRMGNPNKGNIVTLRIDSVTGPVIGRIETTSTGDFNAQQVVYGKHTGPNVSGVHDVFVTFDGSANYQLCMDNCWAAQTNKCEEVYGQGCGNGIGNFDWFHLDTACPASAPFLQEGRCVAACATGCSSNNECVACTATKLVNVRCVPQSQIRVGSKVYCGGQLFRADQQVVTSTNPGPNLSPASHQNVGALVTSPDRWIARINGVVTKLVNQDTLAPVPTTNLGFYTVEFEFLGQGNLAPTKGVTNYRVDVP